MIGNDILEKWLNSILNRQFWLGDMHMTKIKLLFKINKWNHFKICCGSFKHIILLLELSEFDFPRINFFLTNRNEFLFRQDKLFKFRLINILLSNLLYLTMSSLRLLDCRMRFSHLFEVWIFHHEKLINFNFIWWFI